MFRVVQRLLERTSNFLFGDYAKERSESYQELLEALERRKDKVQPKDPEMSDDSDALTLEEIRKVKRDFFARSLQSGVASVYLDPRVQGVKVPDAFRNQVPLVLNYSYRYHIADFEFHDDSIVASLSFGGVPYQCTVPWDAVMGIGNQGEGVFCSFTGEPPPPDEKRGLSKLESQNPQFDQDSHRQATERRKQFKVIKGGAGEN